MHESPVAVVVGLCAHGLAVTRGLARDGLTVHAVEVNSHLPGTRTRYARIHFVDDINGPGLISSLVKVRQRINVTVPPVLFLTNDRMVQQISDHWHLLEGLYSLSWSKCRNEVARLLWKPSLEDHCSRADVNYPKSVLIQTSRDIPVAESVLDFPVMIKPARSLGRLKAQVIDTVQGLKDTVAEFESDLPLVVQRWIPGADDRIAFCALYLRDGVILGRFDGRKWRSRPMGHTTIAEPFPDDAVFRETQKFFGSFDITGPVSLELKRDVDGSLWVIEPTVGRTDFWVGCCIANKVNLPLIEYRDEAGLPLPDYVEQKAVVWLNMERDPLSLAVFLRRCLAFRRRVCPITLVYWDRQDLLPFLASIVDAGLRLTRRVVRKIWESCVSSTRARKDGLMSVPARGRVRESKLERG